MNIETIKKTWRPAMGWALVFINLIYALLICALLIAQLVDFEDVSAFMLAQVGQLAGLGMVTSAGRSYEKRYGMDGAPPEILPEPPQEFPQNPPAENYEGRIG